MDITKKQILKFMLLPGIMPRVKDLALNLNWFAYLMALIFVSTRILPPNHPYAAPEQQGKFGISDILFEAGRNLKGGFRHIDHYIIYGCFVLGLCLLAGQFIILLFIVASHTADAMPSFQGMFVTRNPENDLAMMMLDKVFEIPNMFNSKFDPESSRNISLFGAGLHGIIAFYNEGMLMIAGLIVLYYIFAVVLETVQTGTPFGQRFQEVYVPIRIVLAIALLLPLGYGFSAGQLLVLQLADWGSAFASNGWILFNQKAKTNPLGSGAEQLVSNTKTQEVEDLFRYYSLVHSCRAIYQQQYTKDIKPYIIYFQGGKSHAVLADTINYESALAYFKDGNLKVTFGEFKDSYKQPGKVKPYCGTVNIPSVNTTIDGAKIIQETYWDFLQVLWINPDLTAYGNRMAAQFSNKTNAPTDTTNVDGWSDAEEKPDSGYYANVRAELQPIFSTAMQTAKDRIRNDSESDQKMTDEILGRGWGGAGIWFNKIAEYNGAIVSANGSMPIPSSYPMVMKKVLDQKRTSDQSLSTITQFMTSFNSGTPLKDLMSGNTGDDTAKDGQIATFLNKVYVDMTAYDTYGDGTENLDDNPVAKAMGMIFGTYGLSELRGNQEIHPLAKMSALGRSILDRAILYMGGAMVMGGLSSLSTVLDSYFKLTAQSGTFSASFAGMSDAFISFATIGITVGVVLYYVIPFLPFLYFFFAVGRWVKSVFEAVIGIPLWALAHIRIDGEGIPGQAAAQGYYLLLEILLRPILVIFGLMAAVAAFSALAIVLDTIFDLVITNVTGYSPADEQGSFTWQGKELRRGHIDQFFYTIMYAVILYMMAMSCFKLIDLIPNSVLRFIGSGVAEFNDQMNLEQDIIRYTGISAYTMSKEVAEAGRDFAKMAGQAVVLPVHMHNEMKQKTDEQQAAAAKAAQQQQQAQQQAQQQQMQQQQEAERQRQLEEERKKATERLEEQKKPEPPPEASLAEKIKIGSEVAGDMAKDAAKAATDATQDGAKNLIDTVKEKILGPDEGSKGPPTSPNGGKPK